MKKILLSALLALSVYAATAQVSENTFARLAYTGYSGTHYVLDVTNKQACGVDFYLTWLGNDTTLFIAANATRTVQLPGPAVGNSPIATTPLNRCNGSGGVTSIEITTPSALPVTFVSVSAPRISDNQFMITWQVANPVDVKLYNIQHSLDGLHWETITVFFPDNSNKFSVPVKLSNGKK